MKTPYVSKSNRVQVFVNTKMNVMSLEFSCRVDWLNSKSVLPINYWMNIIYYMTLASAQNQFLKYFQHFLITIVLQLVWNTFFRRQVRKSLFMSLLLKTSKLFKPCSIVRILPKTWITNVVLLFANTKHVSLNVFDHENRSSRPWIDLYLFAVLNCSYKTKCFQAISHCFSFLLL